MMFLDNLSSSVFSLCNTRNITYETASECCNINLEYFLDITQRVVTPSIITLEKLCNGFDFTPNDLLINQNVREQLSYREPLIVEHYGGYYGNEGLYCFPMCPKCQKTMEREYQKYCDRCGQHLDWSKITKATFIDLRKHF